MKYWNLITGKKSGYFSRKIFMHLGKLKKYFSAINSNRLRSIGVFSFKCNYFFTIQVSIYMLQKCIE